MAGDKSLAAEIEAVINPSSLEAGDRPHLEAVRVKRVGNGREPVDNQNAGHEHCHSDQHRGQPLSVSAQTVDRHAADHETGSLVEAESGVGHCTDLQTHRRRAPYRARHASVKSFAAPTPSTSTTARGKD